MTQPAGNYRDQHSAGAFRRQAFRVWAVSAGLAFVWVALIAAAPLARANDMSISEHLYTFFSYICHQLPERSLHLADHPMAVCSRCFGVYFGLFLALATYPLWRSIDNIEPLPRTWLFLSMVPIGIDWSLTMAGIWENTHLSRLITGGILGAACGIYIVPALVEIRQNLALRRRHAS